MPAGESRASAMVPGASSHVSCPPTAAVVARDDGSIAALEENTVALPMYDLSGGLAAFVPSALLGGYKFEGVWHTGVRVFGKEVWYGGGIMQSEFDDCPFGSPVKVVTLGNTTRTHKELLEFIRDELLQAYSPRTYHVLKRNCNHFTNELVQFLLCGQQIPEEVLSQPHWAQNGPLAQLLVPAMNTWLGGFGDTGTALSSAPAIMHMSRAEKEREQKRLAAQWADWVSERQRQRAAEFEDLQKEQDAEEFTNWMLKQHQKMEEEERQAEEAKRQRLIQEERNRVEEEKRRKEEENIRLQQEKARKQQESVAEAQRMWEQQNPEMATRRREAEHTLREIFDSAATAETAVFQWALSEAKDAGVDFSAPFLIRDAEFILREKQAGR